MFCDLSKSAIDPLKKNNEQDILNYCTQDEQKYQKIKIEQKKNSISVKIISETEMMFFVTSIRC